MFSLPRLAKLRTNLAIQHMPKIQKKSSHILINKRKMLKLKDNCSRAAKKSQANIQKPTESQPSPQ